MLKYFDINDSLVCDFNSGVKPVFVIPREKVREDVEEIIGEEASIVFISTPGQVNLPLFVIDCSLW